MEVRLNQSERSLIIYKLCKMTLQTELAPAHNSLVDSMTLSMPQHNKKWFELFLNGGALLFSVMGAVGYISLLQYPYRINYIQAAHFDIIAMLALVSLAGGVLCGMTSLLFSRKRASPSDKNLFWGCILLSSLGIVALFVTPSLEIKSVLSSRNICINNTRVIEAIKEEWRYRNDATNGTKVTWDDIATYFTNGFPRCPDGGKYELGRIGEPVMCSNPKHQIQGR
jgi:hypothetical protein